MAKNGKERKKKRVLIVIEMSRGFGRKLIEGIAQYATEQKRWDFFLCDHDAANQHLQRLEAWNGDGLIARVNNKNLNQFFHKFRGEKINLAADDKEFPIYVRLNNERCGVLAAEHFWERGYRNFSYFSMGHTYWSQFRYYCFVHALQKHESVCFLCPQANRKNSLTLPTLWWSGLDDSVLNWVKSLPKPIGIFCANDNHAFYLTNLCSSYDVGIPEEVAILGTDNDESLCKTTTPPISSINPNAKIIGYQSAKILDLMMNGDPLPEFPILVDPAGIVVRQSTDNIAVNDPIVAHALRFIRTEVARNLRVSDVTKETGVSRGTLNMLFHQHLRCSPIEEIIRIRMKWAKELLRDTPISVAEISQMLGYQTPEYFSHAFTRVENISPRNYRILHQSTKKRE
ncbi:MAG: DNA-binding transcriptional regulator [Planctomycetaceae bacterium]|jgi:LacI family transcriptional regulator|nr:DNA-binding transcriptional regulator [Planctomycetaceae bacterium]